MYAEVAAFHVTAAYKPETISSYKVEVVKDV